MSDIHTILSKHFTGEISPEEELQVHQFKEKNPEEYEALKLFWTRKDIDLIEVDQVKAWNKIKKHQAPAKEIRLYTQVKKLAAVAAIFILVFGGFQFYKTQFATHESKVLFAEFNKEKVTLEDGSVVSLNKGASIHYPDKFDSDQRVISLSGEAFFEIEKDVNRPFIINTTHCDVTVLGTSFNISTQQKQTEVTVATGRVKVQSKSTKEMAFLVANQQTTVTKDTLVKQMVENKNYRSWDTGYFEFEQTPLENVIAELNAYYDDKITLNNTDSDCLFSSKMEQQNIDEIVKIIQLSCGLKVRQNKDTYELY